MARFTLVLSALLVMGLTSVSAARADVSFGPPSGLALSLSAPFVLSAAIIGAGSWANLGGKGWRVSAYVAGAVNIAGGIGMLVPALSDGHNQGVGAASTLLFLTGGACIAAALVGANLDASETGGISVTPVVLRSPAMGQAAPGLALYGAF